MKLNIVLTTVFVCGVVLLLADPGNYAHKAEPPGSSVVQATGSVCQQFDPNQPGDCGNSGCGFSSYTYNDGYTNGPGIQSLEIRTFTCPAGVLGSSDNPCRTDAAQSLVAVSDVNCCDRDNDGFSSTACGGTDCNDNDWYINPGKAEICGDGINNDCNAGTSDTCPDYDFCAEMAAECELRGGIWKGCIRGCYSPIVLDVQGNGFDLTGSGYGTNFDIDGDGSAEQLSWTAAGSDDAWLFLDRNGNSRVDSGQELFGNFTSQPASSEPNGFLALAEYDKPENGGNNDGRIDNRDSIFSSLQLWQDTNHNGISEPDELHSLPSLDVMTLHLNYKESKRTDEHGNHFKYRAKIDDAKGAKAGRWAWDVFLQKAP
ncbi:MAG: putative metal-binding motif-containing protein [Pyrinomonadaceae bacterium]